MCSVCLHEEATYDQRRAGVADKDAPLSRRLVDSHRLNAIGHPQNQA